MAVRQTFQFSKGSQRFERAQARRRTPSCGEFGISLASPLQGDLSKVRRLKVKGARSCKPGIRQGCRWGSSRYCREDWAALAAKRRTVEPRRTNDASIPFIWRAFRWLMALEASLVKTALPDSCRNERSISASSSTASLIMPSSCWMSRELS